MKKLFNLILISILAFSTLKANAVILSDTDAKSIIASQVAQRYKRYTDAQVEVEVVALPFRTISLPDGKVSFSVESNMDKFLARDLEKVTIYVDNQFVKSFNAPVVVKAYQNVLIASTPISRERTIDYSVVKVEKREISNNLANALTQEAIGKDIVAKKFFVAGEIIDKRFVKLKPDVLRNSIVTVLFKTGDLTVSIDALALSDGVIGDNICIMNKSYNKVYKGRVIGENKVLVSI